MMYILTTTYMNSAAIGVFDSKIRVIQALRDFCYDERLTDLQRQYYDNPECTSETWVAFNHVDKCWEYFDIDECKINTLKIVTNKKSP